MKIEITGEPKEIAALVLAVQERQNREVLAIGEISAKGHSSDVERIISLLSASVKTERDD